MKRISMTLSAAALAALGGCGGYDTVTPVGQPVTTAPGAVVTTTPGPVVAAPAPVVTAPAPVATVPSGTVVAPGAVVSPGVAVVVPGTAGVRAGVGRVESNTRISRAGGQGSPTRRVGVRMDDGTIQYVETEAANLEIGDRVELTADNHIRYGMARRQ